MVQVVQLTALTLQKSNLTSTLAIEKVFGKDFLENRTSSCSYHFGNSVARHKACIKKENIQIYMKLPSNLKDCVTVEE